MMQNPNQYGQGNPGMVQNPNQFGQGNPGMVQNPNQFGQGNPGMGSWPWIAGFGQNLWQGPMQGNPGVQQPYFDPNMMPMAAAMMQQQQQQKAGWSNPYSDVQYSNFYQQQAGHSAVPGTSFGDGGGKTLPSLFSPLPDFRKIRTLESSNKSVEADHAGKRKEEIESSKKSVEADKRGKRKEEIESNKKSVEADNTGKRKEEIESSKKSVEADKRGKRKEDIDHSDDDDEREDGQTDYATDPTCEVCNIHFNAESQLWTHMSGKKHMKAVKAVAEGRPVKGQGPVKGQAKSGKDVVNLSDMCVERVLATAHVGEPVVGLSFIRELNTNTNEQLFVCELCEMKGPVNNIALHIVGFKHRMSYLKFNDPVRYNLLNRTEKKTNLMEMVRNFCLESQLEQESGKVRYIYRTPVAEVTSSTTRKSTKSVSPGREESSKHRRPREAQRDKARDSRSLSHSRSPENRHSSELRSRHRRESAEGKKNKGVPPSQDLRNHEKVQEWKRALVSDFHTQNVDPLLTQHIVDSKEDLLMEYVRQGVSYLVVRERMLLFVAERIQQRSSSPAYRSPSPSHLSYVQQQQSTLFSPDDGQNRSCVTSERRNRQSPVDAESGSKDPKHPGQNAKKRNLLSRSYSPEGRTNATQTSKRKAHRTRESPETISSRSSESPEMSKRARNVQDESYSPYQASRWDQRKPSSPSNWYDVLLNSPVEAERQRDPSSPQRQTLQRTRHASVSLESLSPGSNFDSSPKKKKASRVKKTRVPFLEDISSSEEERERKLIPGNNRRVIETRNRSLEQRMFDENSDTEVQDKNLQDFLSKISSLGQTVSSTSLGNDLEDGHERQPARDANTLENEIQAVLLEMLEMKISLEEARRRILVLQKRHRDLAKVETQQEQERSRPGSSSANQENLKKLRLLRDQVAKEEHDFRMASYERAEKGKNVGYRETKHFEETFAEHHDEPSPRERHRERLSHGDRIPKSSDLDDLDRMARRFGKRALSSSPSPDRDYAKEEYSSRGASPSGSENSSSVEKLVNELDSYLLEVGGERLAQQFVTDFNKKVGDDRRQSNSSRRSRSSSLESLEPRPKKKRPLQSELNSPPRAGRQEESSSKLQFTLDRTFSGDEWMRRKQNRLQSVKNVLDSSSSDSSDSECKATQKEETARVRSIAAEAEVKSIVQGEAPVQSVLPRFDVTPVSLRMMQSSETVLAGFITQARNHAVFSQSDGRVRFQLFDNLLYRTVISSQGHTERFLVLPNELKYSAMLAAHVTLAGHLNVEDTTQRVKHEFWWPVMEGDIIRFCQNCHVCAQTPPSPRVPTAAPRQDEPFSRVAVALQSVKTPGHSCVLMVVDFATGIAEMIPIPKLFASEMVTLLQLVFCRLGFPRTILYDRDGSLTSPFMNEVLKMMSKHPLCSGPIQLESDDTVKRFVHSLRLLVRKMVDECDDWDKLLPAFSFLIREIPSEDLGTLSVESQYNRCTILREIWTQVWTPDKVVSGLLPSYRAVFELDSRLPKTCKFAQEYSALVQKYFIAPTGVEKKYKIAQQVYILQPAPFNKLMVTWTGPHDYVSDVAGEKHQCLVFAKNEGQVIKVPCALVKAFEANVPPPLVSTGLHQLLAYGSHDNVHDSNKKDSDKRKGSVSRESSLSGNSDRRGRSQSKGRGRNRFARSRSRSRSRYNRSRSKSPSISRYNEDLRSRDRYRGKDRSRSPQRASLSDRRDKTEKEKRIDRAARDRRQRSLSRDRRQRSLSRDRRKRSLSRDRRQRSLSRERNPERGVRQWHSRQSERLGFGGRSRRSTSRNRSRRSQEKSKHSPRRDGSKSSTSRDKPEKSKDMPNQSSSDSKSNALPRLGLKEKLDAFSKCDFDIYSVSFWQQQQASKDLESAFLRAKGSNTNSKYKVVDGFLYQISANAEDFGSLQLVIPRDLTERVKLMAEVMVMAGCWSNFSRMHLLIPCVLRHMTWPTIMKDFGAEDSRHYMQDNWGLISEALSHTAGKLFKSVAVSALGPAECATKSGSKYIILVVDSESSFPEAAALPTMDASALAEGLRPILTRMHCPEKIYLSSSGLMNKDMLKEALKILAKDLPVQTLSCSVGKACDRITSTAKSVLGELMTECASDWDTMLHSVMFVCRNMPSDHGYSPFEVDFGCLALLQELWTRNQDAALRAQYLNVFRLKNLLPKTFELIRDLAVKISSKFYLRRKLEHIGKEFQRAERLMALMPSDDNKLLMQWAGPFKLQRTSRTRGFALVLADGCVQWFYVVKEQGSPEDKQSAADPQAADKTDIVNAGKPDDSTECPPAADKTDIANDDSTECPPAADKTDIANDDSNKGPPAADKTDIANAGKSDDSTKRLQAADKKDIANAGKSDDRTKRPMARKDNKKLQSKRKEPLKRNRSRSSVDKTDGTAGKKKNKGEIVDDKGDDTDDACYCHDCKLKLKSEQDLWRHFSSEEHMKVIMAGPNTKNDVETCDKDVTMCTDAQSTTPKEELKSKDLALGEPLVPSQDEKKEAMSADSDFKAGEHVLSSDQTPVLEETTHMDISNDVTSSAAGEVSESPVYGEQEEFPVVGDDTTVVSDEATAIAPDNEAVPEGENLSANQPPSYRDDEPSLGATEIKDFAMSDETIITTSKRENEGTENESPVYGQNEDSMCHFEAEVSTTCDADLDNEEVEEMFTVEDGTAVSSPEYEIEAAGVNVGINSNTQVDETCEVNVPEEEECEILTVEDSSNSNLQLDETCVVNVPEEEEEYEIITVEDEPAVTSNEYEIVEEAGVNADSTNSNAQVDETWETNVPEEIEDEIHTVEDDHAVTSNEYGIEEEAGENDVTTDSNAQVDEAYEANVAEEIEDEIPTVKDDTAVSSNEYGIEEEAGDNDVSTNSNAQVDEACEETVPEEVADDMPTVDDEHEIEEEASLNVSTNSNAQADGTWESNVPEDAKNEMHNIEDDTALTSNEHEIEEEAGVKADSTDYNAEVDEAYEESVPEEVEDGMPTVENDTAVTSNECEIEEKAGDSDVSRNSNAQVDDACDENVSEETERDMPTVEDDTAVSSHEKEIEEEAGVNADSTDYNALVNKAYEANVSEETERDLPNVEDDTAVSSNENEIEEEAGVNADSTDYNALINEACEANVSEETERDMPTVEDDTAVSSYENEIEEEAGVNADSTNSTAQVEEAYEENVPEEVENDMPTLKDDAAVSSNEYENEEEAGEDVSTNSNAQVDEACESNVPEEIEDEIQTAEDDTAVSSHEYERENEVTVNDVSTDSNAQVDEAFEANVQEEVDDDQPIVEDDTAVTSNEYGIEEKAGDNDLSTNSNAQVDDACEENDSEEIEEIWTILDDTAVSSHECEMEEAGVNADSTDYNAQVDGVNADSTDYNAQVDETNKENVPEEVEDEIPTVEDDAALSSNEYEIEGEAGDDDISTNSNAQVDETYEANVPEEIGDEMLTVDDDAAVSSLNYEIKEEEADDSDVNIYSDRQIDETHVANVPEGAADVKENVGLVDIDVQDSQPHVEETDDTILVPKEIEMDAGLASAADDAEDCDAVLATGNEDDVEFASSSKKGQLLSTDYCMAEAESVSTAADDKDICASSETVTEMELSALQNTSDEAAWEDEDGTEIIELDENELLGDGSDFAVAEEDSSANVDTCTEMEQSHQ